MSRPLNRFHPPLMPRCPRVCILADLLEHAAAVACDVAAVLLAVCLVILAHALGLGLDRSGEIDLTHRSPLFHLCYLPDNLVVEIYKDEFQCVWSDG